MNNFETLSLDIMLTYDCNFRCKYCYEKNLNYKDSFISNDVVEQSFKFIDTLIYKYFQKITLNFWGGEPSLQKKVIEKYIDRYIDNNNVSFTLFTNGLLIKDFDDILEKCHKKSFQKFHTQISYDFEPLNTKNRLCIDKKDSSQIVRDNARWMVMKNYSFNFKSTCFVKDFDKNLFNVYYDFYNFRKELLILNPETKSNIVYALTPDKLNSSDLKLELLEYELKKLLKFFYDNNIRKTYFNWFDDEYARKLCSAGKNLLGLDIDGNIRHCHGTFFSKNKNKFNICNIYEPDVFDKIVLSNQMILNESEKCKKCESVICFKCNAMCHDSNYNNFNTFLDRWESPNDEYTCKMYQLITRYILAFKKVMR